MYFVFNLVLQQMNNHSPGVFLGKGVLKLCTKFTGEHPYRSVISIKLQLRTPLPKNIPGRLLLICGRSYGNQYEFLEKSHTLRFFYIGI